MKKILLITLVFVFSLSLAGMAAARAKAYKPPATICFNIMEGDSEFSLLIKPMGNIKMSDGPVKIYSVQGLYYDSTNGPGTVIGSGYMDGSIFRFSVNGVYTWQGLAGFFQGDGYWNVDTKTGPMYPFFDAKTHGTWSLVEVPCTQQ